MTENKSEDVLCARILDMPIQWLGPSVAIPMREDDFFSFLDHTTPLWIERSVAENDDNFKQLIPYILLTNSQGLLATYPRRGTEARLHGSWSLGLGGHINTSDQSQTDPQTWRNLLYTGLKRELSEEFPSSVPGHTHFLGVINENLSAVGRVHLGVVFLHQSTGSCNKPGAELDGLDWVEPSQIGFQDWHLDRFELWSQLAIRLSPKYITT